MLMKHISLGLVVACLAIGLGGCSRTSNHTDSPAQVADAGHQHEGWWCDEHGVPEEVCALCNKKVAAGFKGKGDWCTEHDRPESQCFICHPEREAEFAALYEAKYGKQPPKPEDGGAAGHDHS